MDKYIKAQDLIDRIYPVDPENDGSDGCTVVYQNLTLSSPEIEAIVEELPAADVAPVVHGRWVRIYEDGEPAIGQHKIGVCCSKCMKMPKDKITESDYCPNCGAKMDGGKENV